MQILETRRAWLAAIVTLICVAPIQLSTGAGRLSALSQADSGMPPVPAVKEPADEPSTIREAYEFIGTHPEISRYIPCFCACYRNKKHHSIEDCYVKNRAGSTGRITWSDHAAKCSVCLEVAEETRRLYLEGVRFPELRAKIEQYGTQFKFHTPTPEPTTAQN